jgi:hypothetical protein
MKLLDVGEEAVGMIAIGQRATGIIAFGQLATGVVAIGQVATGVVAVGQVARGVFVIGQLAIGVAALGQLVIALTYGGGMVGIAGVRATPSLLIWGVGGRGRIFHNRRFDPTFVAYRTSAALNVVRGVVLTAIAVAVISVALGWLPDYLTNGLDGPAQPPPPTFAPGTR